MCLVAAYDAESEGFEPSVPAKAHTLSRRARSTALATLCERGAKIS